MLDDGNLVIACKDIARQRGLLPRDVDMPTKSTNNLHTEVTHPKPLSPGGGTETAAMSPTEGTRRRLAKQYGRVYEPEKPAPAEKISHEECSEKTYELRQSSSGVNGSGNVNAAGGRTPCSTDYDGEHNGR